MRKLQVLIVEDHLLSQRMAELLLQALGCEVDKACNGLEAIELFAINKYDLIFLDLGLPQLDGFAVAKMIRSKENERRVPIIALTANKDEEYVSMCVLAGIDDCIAKPLTMESAKMVMDRFIV